MNEAGENSVLDGQAERILALEQRIQTEGRLEEERAKWRQGMACAFKPAPRYELKHVGAKIVVRCAKRDATMHGILLPDASRDVPGQGIVVSAGEGSPYAVGEQVVFSKFVGATLALPDGRLLNEAGVEYRILSSDEVYGCWPLDAQQSKEPQRGEEGKTTLAELRERGEAGVSPDA